MELCLSDLPSPPSNSVSLSHTCARQSLVHLKLETHSLCACLCLCPQPKMNANGELGNCSNSIG